MKTPLSFKILPFAATVVLSLIFAAAPVQAGDRAPEKPSTQPVITGVSGNFKSTDGTTGTFRQTNTFYSLQSSSVTVVYTRGTDQATRTETTNYLTSPDGTRSENFTATDYGAATSFTSNRSITGLGRGQFVGAGNYTTAAGVSGTLTTVETSSAGGVNVLTSVYSSPAAGITTEQRTLTNAAGPVLEHTLATVAGQVLILTSVGAIDTAPVTTFSAGALASIASKTVIKTVTVDPTGKATSNVQTRTLEGSNFSLLP